MQLTTRRGRHSRERSRVSVRERLTGPALVVGVAIAQFGVVWVAIRSVRTTLTVAAGMALVAGCFIAPTVVMSAAFPASFGTQRVGPAVVDLSIADAVAFLGTLASLPHVPWHSRTFRRVLIAAASYAAVVSVAVLANPTLAGAVEVGHRFVMVMGGVCIGAAVVRTGSLTRALRWLMAMATLVALIAVKDTLTHDLRPAYALGMQKNASGTLLVTSILVLFFAEKHLGWPRKWTIPIGVVLLCGLAATQSRGAGTALVAAFVVYLVRSTWQRRGRQFARVVPFILVGGILLSAVMVTSFRNQAAEHQGVNHKFGSVGSRELTYGVAWNEVIKPNPILGIGPKWFTRKDAPGGEPHNLVLDELTSDGILGLLALGFLLWTCLRATGATRSELRDVAFYVLFARIVADLFDIFWVAGPNTLPFLVFGLAVGAASLDEERLGVTGGAAAPIGAGTS